MEAGDFCPVKISGAHGNCSAIAAYPLGGHRHCDLMSGLWLFEHFGTSEMDGSWLHRG